MPKIEVTVESAVKQSFRVKQVAGLFDLDLKAKSRRSWSVQVPGLDEDWQIGAIVGPSGSGKTVVARKASGDKLATGFDWPRDKAVVEAFDPALSIKDVTGILNSVGFSSPPAWVLPYSVLSNGQQFRCDLARALLTPADCLWFDEFTSVVDRRSPSSAPPPWPKPSARGGPSTAPGGSWPSRATTTCWTGSSRIGCWTWRASSSRGGGFNGSGAGSTNSSTTGRPSPSASFVATVKRGACLRRITI